jgi:uncharacterized protein (TIGR01244 family)
VLTFIKSISSLTLLVVLACANAQQGDLPNRSDPLPGITASGQPDQAALKELADAGYVAVIDLRGVNEDRGFDEQAAVEELGMSYLPLPITGAGSVTYENASARDELLSEIDGPVLLHCASSNRVGAVLALRHRLNGASSEESLQLGDQAGLSSLRESVEARLSER